MEPSSTAYRPRRKPARETLEKLLAAAEEQLREQDLNAFTIQNVLNRAGLSVGAFYSRFPDKTALLHAVHERVHARVEPRILSELAKAKDGCKTLEEAVDRGFGILIRHVIGERELFRAFMMLSVFDPSMRERGEQVNLARKKALAEILTAHLAEIGHRDPERALNSAYAIYSGTIRSRLVYYGSRNEMQFGVTDDTLFGDLKRSLALFLTGGQATKPPSH